MNNEEEAFLSWGIYEVPQRRIFTETNNRKGIMKDMHCYNPNWI